MSCSLPLCFGSCIPNEGRECEKCEWFDNCVNADD